MKKSWIALLLTPCLAFAAYPIYENDFDEQEVAETEHSDVLQYGLGENRAADEEAVAYENEAADEEMAAIPEQPVQKRESASRSIQQKRMQRSAKVTAPSAQRKQAAAVSKRSPMKKNSSAKSSASPRSKVQESRQNSNRPRVTHRGHGQNHSQNQIEADAQPDAGSMYEEHEQAPKASKQAAAPKKSSLTQRSDKMVNRQSGSSKKSSKGMKYKEKSAKLHHPGKRPLSE